MGFLIGLIPTQYQFIAKIVSSILLIIAILIAWHRFTGHYEDIGKQEITKQLQPKIDSLKIENDSLQNRINELESANKSLGMAVNDCNTRVDGLVRTSNELKAKSDAALLDVQKKHATALQEKAWLEQQLAKPDIKGKTCVDALKEWATHE